MCSISVYVCLCPLGATAGDNVSCPLRPHLHHHPSWCHLSWLRTKLSPWEKLACLAPCSDSTQSCPAPTHACSLSALLAMIRASLPGLRTHKKTRSNRRERRCWWPPERSQQRCVWVCYCYCIRMRMIHRSMLSKNINLLNHWSEADTDKMGFIILLVRKFFKMVIKWSV